MGLPTGSRTASPRRQPPAPGLAAGTRVPAPATLALALILGCLTPWAWSAPDKSGVQPTVLSLPSGPGSIEGLGESFEPQPNSGTASYSVAFDAPPGRAGFGPSIGIQYNSGDGNGPVGLGWRINLPSIQRQTDKGLPYYTDYPDLDQKDNDKDGTTDEPDEWDTILATSGEELVPLADGTFRAENESDFTRYQRDGDGWLVTQSDGTRLRLAEVRMSAGSHPVRAYRLIFRVHFI